MMPIDDAFRAERRVSKNLRSSEQIVLTRDTPITDDAPPAGPTTLAAQTFKVVRDNRPRDLRGESGQGTELHCTMFGVRDHAIVPDSDIERGDRFELDGDHYVVDYVNLVHGGKQAVCVLWAVGL